jgi:hypothetical protein
MHVAFVGKSGILEKCFIFVCIAMFHVQYCILIILSGVHYTCATCICHENFQECAQFSEVIYSFFPILRTFFKDGKILTNATAGCCVCLLPASQDCTIALEFSLLLWPFSMCSMTDTFLGIFISLLCSLNLAKDTKKQATL